MTNSWYLEIPTERARRWSIAVARQQALSANGQATYQLMRTSWRRRSWQTTARWVPCE